MNPKKLVILGATGGTGQQLVRQGLEAGHEISAFVRTPAKLPVQHACLQVVSGTLPDDEATLAAAARGKDAVISALGRGTSLTSTGLIQRSVPAILSAVLASGVSRLIFTSAIGVGDSVREAPLFSRVLIRLLLKDIYADKAAGEDLIRSCRLNWTIVQPAQLTNGPITGTYRVGEHLTLRGMPTIGRADLAHFMLSLLDDTAYVGKIVRIGY